MKFLKQLGTKYASIKFEKKVLKENLQYRNRYQKQTLKHPKLLQNSILYIEKPQIKKSAQPKNNLTFTHEVLKKYFWSKDQKLVNQQQEKVKKLVRNNLLQKKIEKNKI